MSSLLTENQIATLLAEPKTVRGSFSGTFPFRVKGAHHECEYAIETLSGNHFQIRVRQSAKNPLDFSVILIYLLSETGLEIRLVRYNGKSHEHLNPIEKHRFYDFHIHHATERYMRRGGSSPETFAEETNRYSDINGAFRCLLDDCKISFDQPSLL